MTYTDISGSFPGADDPRTIWGSPPWQLSRADFEGMIEGLHELRLLAEEIANRQADLYAALMPRAEGEPERPVDV